MTGTYGLEEKHSREDDYFPISINSLFLSVCLVLPIFCRGTHVTRIMLCRDTSRADIVVASLGLFTWPLYVRSYCVPIATLNQNKPSLLLYLGRAQIIINYTYHGIFHNSRP